MKAARGQIGRLLDQPSADTRFYLFWGADEAQSRAHAMRLLQALGADRFMIISQHIKSDPAALADEAGALALFGGKRVIWIEPAGDDIRGGVEALLDAAIIESPVVAITPSAAKPRDLIKLAEGSKLALSFASYAPEGAEAERMVIDVGRRFGLRIASPVAGRLAAACGNDQAIVSQELEKMALYLDASTARPTELDHDTIDAIGADIDQDNFLRISDLALSGNVRETAELLGSANVAGDAIPIVRALQRRIQMLAPARARVERGDGSGDVMAALGKALFWKDKAIFGKMLAAWSAGDLERLSERVARLERDFLFSAAPAQEALGEELLAVARAASRR